MKRPLSDMTRRSFVQGACALGAALVLPVSLLGSLAAQDAHAATDGLAGPGIQQQTRLLMGTMVTLTAATPDPGRAEAAFAAAFAEMERLIAIFDRREAAGALGILNAQGSLADVPPELAHVLIQAERIGGATQHAFNPAIAPLVDMLEAAKQTRGPLPGHGDSSFKQALALSAPGGVSLSASCGASGSFIRLERAGMRLTLDGIAKGFIADAASAVLSRNAIEHHLVNAGGDIRVQGLSAQGKPWTIGVRNPVNAKAPLARVRLTAGALATSGGYENTYDAKGARHHLLNHQTGNSARNISVTVRAANALRADALATALSLLPPAQALRLAEASPDAACLILDEHGRLHSSARWT